jgi:hypothetical protein
LVGGVFARYLAEIRRLVDGGGGRLDRHAAGLEATVRDLTAQETACCSFFTFTVTPEPAEDGAALTLDIEVPARYTDVLASLAERASTVSSGQAS